jgi:fused-like protein
VLGYLHSAGVVHRDLKPENIMLCEDGTVKLVDFGLAATQANPCEVGQIVGSPGYVAPEILHQQPYDHRVDLFSLGCVLYTILFNKLPFKGKTLKARVLANARCQVEFPKSSLITSAGRSFLSGLLDRLAERRVTV